MKVRVLFSLLQLKLPWTEGLIPKAFWVEGFIALLKVTAIGVINDENLRVLAVYNQEGLSWNVGDSIPLRGSGLEWAVLDKKSLIYPNSQNASPGSIVNEMLNTGHKSILCLPLITKEEVSDRVLDRVAEYLGVRDREAFRG